MQVVFRISKYKENKMKHVTQKYLTLGQLSQVAAQLSDTVAGVSPPSAMNAKLTHKDFVAFIKDIVPAGDLEQADSPEAVALRNKLNKLEVAAFKASKKAKTPAEMLEIIRAGTAEREEIQRQLDVLSEVDGRILALIGQMFDRPEFEVGLDTVKIGQNTTLLNKKYGVKFLVMLPVCDGTAPFNERHTGLIPLAIEEGETLKVVALQKAEKSLSAFCNTLAVRLGNDRHKAGINQCELYDAAQKAISISDALDIW